MSGRPQTPVGPPVRRLLKICRPLELTRAKPRWTESWLKCIRTILKNVKIPNHYQKSHISGPWLIKKTSDIRTILKKVQKTLRRPFSKKSQKLYADHSQKSPTFLTILKKVLSKMSLPFSNMSYTRSRTCGTSSTSITNGFVCFRWKHVMQTMVTISKLTMTVFNRNKQNC